VEDDAKPLIQFNRGSIRWDPAVKGLTINTNSIFNGCYSLRVSDCRKSLKTCHLARAA
jgi:hypothetical protein